MRRLAVSTVAVIPLLLVGCDRVWGLERSPLDAAVVEPVAWSTVSAGLSSTCAIDTNAHLWCWGDNERGQIGVGSPVTEIGAPTQVGTETWSAVSVGTQHACGLQPDHALYCWGHGGNGELGVSTFTNSLVPVRVDGEWSSVYTGYFRTCGIKIDGTLWCWGFTSTGELGLGGLSAASVDLPNQVAPGTTWSQISLGRLATCGIDTQHQLWCWGSNTSGQLGVNGPTAVATPQLVGGTWSQVSAGSIHACGIDLAGALWCWGSNATGQLGGGSQPRSTVPLRIDTGPWATITAADGYTCATREDATQWCWGTSLEGQYGEAAQTGTPVMIGSSIRSVAAKDEHACRVTVDGTLECTGLDGSNQLGTGTGGARTRPTKVAGTWELVATSLYTTCGKRTSGERACWGTNTYYQLGDASQPRFRATPYDFPVVPNLTALGLGFQHGCYLAGGGVACWGYSPLGQVGGAGSSLGPRGVGVVAPVAIATGAHSCAATASSILCWGPNTSGQLGQTPDDQPHATPLPIAGPVGLFGAHAVAASTVHSCALNTAHALWCWGSNANGQIRSPVSPTPLTPLSIPGMWTSVAAGDTTTCGIQADSTAKCWGRLAPVLSGLWSQVDVGATHACAIRSDGSLWCWGANSRGELGDGTTTPHSDARQVDAPNRWVVVATGGQNTCAIDDQQQLFCWGSDQYGALGVGSSVRRGWATVPAPP